jgi:hypothetical protein
MQRPERGVAHEAQAATGAEEIAMEFDAIVI